MKGCIVLKSKEGADKMSRNELYNEVQEILEFQCKGCFVHNQFKKEKGRRFAHKFCISQCTIGEQLRKVGNKLVK
ncbi:zinc-finger domain-containing protein [Peribacillus loiseleuriae]|uniref:zinc-finger domain-containing protein n=1 Tax=Peribacillus loiseleuriae TaxID=1679170 RepID=UPI003CFC844D